MAAVRSRVDLYFCIFPTNSVDNNRPIPCVYRFVTSRRVYYNKYVFSA